MHRHLARQIERHADIYMSRVSNLLAYAYLRAPRVSLPHELALESSWRNGPAIDPEGTYPL